MRRLLEELGLQSTSSVLQVLWQFVKFGVVGISNTVVSLAIYYFLLYFGVHYLLAHCIGFLISVVNAFFWNSRYVFNTSKVDKRLAFVKTVASYGGTFLLGLGFIWILIEFLSFSEIIAPLINLCITIPLNFLLNKLWAFRK